MRDITSKLPKDFISYVSEHQAFPHTAPEGFPRHIRSRARPAEALETVEAVAQSCSPFSIKLLPDELSKSWDTMILSGEIASAMPIFVRPEVIREIEARLRRPAPWHRSGV